MNYVVHYVMERDTLKEKIVHTWVKTFNLYKYKHIELFNARQFDLSQQEKHRCNNQRLDRCNVVLLITSVFFLQYINMSPLKKHIGKNLYIHILVLQILHIA